MGKYISTVGCYLGEYLASRGDLKVNLWEYQGMLMPRKGKTVKLRLKYGYRSTGKV